MRPSDAFALGLEFGLPTLIVGGAIIGSTLRAERRRQFETWVLLPLFVVLTAGGIAVTIYYRWWIGTALFVVLFGFAVERLIRRIRALRRAPQEPAR